MLDLSAFDPAPDSCRTVPSPPASSGGLVFDADGLAIPPLWQNALDRWAKLPPKSRKDFSDAEIARAERLAAKKPRQRRLSVAKRFTTDYAVAWGRAQGWKLIDRENYNFRTKNHHDLQMGLDALFDDGVDGMIGIQGAGRNERAEHYQRFLDRG